MKRITIVSLAFNKLEMTRSFLMRLKAHTDIPFNIIFTDNGSTEPIGKLFKEIFPEGKLITKKENVGCPATRNEAMQFVKTDICFWVDNDCMVGPNWYQPILDQLKDKEVGVSGPLGCVVNEPFEPSYPFKAKDPMQGDCDYFVGYLVGFKTKAYKPINDYHLAVNLDDVELCFGVKENGFRSVISEPCFANHLTSQTERAWSEQEPIEKMWDNWKDKSIFENYKHR